MTNRCPGQDSRNIQVESIKCPVCGYLLEIFSDEIRARCPACRGLICKNKLPSCVDWCKAAKECMGEKTQTQLKGGN